MMMRSRSGWALFTRKKGLHLTTLPLIPTSHAILVKTEVQRVDGLAILRKMNCAHLVYVSF